MSYTEITPRQGTAAQWTASNPILASGEVGYETDTHRSKRGNGTTNWRTLPYLDGPGVGVFKAADYGVIADGAQHNNVANLLDCLAACVAAGGGTVSLPTGTIVTSEANIGTVTADSGRTFTNTGALPVPPRVPIVIQGPGSGLCTVKLSPGFSRFVDLRRAADGDTFAGITVRGVTVDRQHLSGVDQGRAATTNGSPIVMAAQASASVPCSDSRFSNANMFFHEESGMIIPGTYNPGTGTLSLTNYLGGGTITINPGDHISGALWGHAVFGNAPQGWYGWWSYSVNMDGITVEDVVGVNLNPPEWDPASPLRDFPMGISLSTRVNTSQGSITNVSIKNCKIYGGGHGFVVTGSNAGTWLDNIDIDGCYHDSMATLPGYTSSGQPGAHATVYSGINFMIGGLAWLGYARVANCEGHRSGDVALEVDQPWRFVEENNHWYDYYGYGVFFKSFTPPARTAAGPPTATTAGGAAIAAAVTSCTIAAFPVEADRRGWAEISSAAGKEIVWYSATNEAGTAWSLQRGQYGSTALNHSNGSSIVITVIQTPKTRITSTNSKFTATETTVGAAYYATGGPAGQNYPAPPISINSPTAHIVGDLRNGIFYRSDTWVPEADIRDARVYYRFDSTITDPWTQLLAGGGSVMSTWLPIAVPSGAPTPRLVGRNNKFVISGRYPTANKGWIVGYLQQSGTMLFDLALDVVFDVFQSSGQYAAYLAAGTVAKGSKLTIGVSTVGAPTGTDTIGLLTANSAALTVESLDATVNDGSVYGLSGYTRATLNSQPVLVNRDRDLVFPIVDGVAFEIDPANGGIQTLTLGAARTPKATAFTSGQSVLLHVAATPYAITWTDATLNPTWVGGSAPVLSSTQQTVIALWKVGTVMYGCLIGYV